MSSTTRKQAPRLARPAARYWKGKAPKGVNVATLDVDSDEEEEYDPEAQADPGDVSLSGELALGGEDEEDDDDDDHLARAAPALKKGINVALKDVNISRDGKVIVAGREESGRTVEEVEESSDEEEENVKPGDEESEEESSEEESESEEEQPKLLFRPVFVPKRARVTVAEKDALTQDTEEAAKRKEAEAEERKKQSHDMVAESIRRELAEKEKEEDTPDVDDNDGIDPEGEFEAWRLRELGRIKRDKEDEVRREEEREEIERRRALPEEQRLREDMEHADKTRSDKPKGQQKFLQKYWHKGAFHQDEEILQRHDFTEATASTMDVSMLPKVMQVKNFGKRGRTKYTHLVDQDTTQSVGGFGGAGSIQTGGTQGGCFLCGGPHMKKDCPQNVDLPPGQRGSTGTGANNVDVVARGSSRGKWDNDRPPPPRNSDHGDRYSRPSDNRDNGRGRTGDSWHDRDRDLNDDKRPNGRHERDAHHADRYDARDRDQHRPRSRSRPSPPRERRDAGRRRSRTRSRSHSGDRQRADDKRRRLD